MNGISVATTRAWSVRASSSVVVRGFSQTHRQSRGRRGLGGAEVRVVGGDDRQVVDPLGIRQRRLRGDQALPVGVAAGEEELGGGGERLLGPAPKRAGGQLGRVVHEDGPAMRRAEEADRSPAPDHPHPQLPPAAHPAFPPVASDGSERSFSRRPTRVSSVLPS